MIGGGTGALFRVPETEDHGTPGFDAALEQRFRRFEQTENGALVVECTAAPDVSVGHVTGKRSMLPALLGARLDRYDVLMAHQKHRRERRVAAAPRV